MTGCGLVGVAAAAGCALMLAGPESAGATPSATAVAPAPLVRGFAPAKGPAGTVVTLTGRYFTGATGVSVGGAGSAFTVLDDRTLTLTVPPLAGTGPVAVTSPAGTGTGPDFTLDARTIRGFSPTSGPPGTAVLLNGFNFLGTGAVLFAGVRSAAFTVVDDRTIYAVVPVGAGVGPITVQEGLAVGTSVPYTYDPVTRIRGFYPTAGGAGTVVTINGVNFAGASAVDFGGTSASSFDVVSNSQIQAVVPEGAASGPISVHGVGNVGSFASVAFTVLAAPEIFPLSVAVMGLGSGVVVSTPAGISCGSACVASFSFPTTVTLTASPGAGSDFGLWTGDCAASTGNVCTVTLSAARSVGVVFTRVTYTLAVGLSGGGGGSVSSSPAGIACGSTCSASFDSGTVVTLSAAADVGASFAGWLGCDSVSGVTCAVVLSSARSVTAGFAYPLSVSVGGSGSGLVSSSPVGLSCSSSCVASFGVGQTVTLTASPSAGSTLASWTGCDSSSGVTCTVSMSSVRSVGVSFSPVRYLLSVARSGSGGGSVSSSPAGIACGSTCSASFDSGTVVTLSAAADVGASFAGWLGCDSVSGVTCAVVLSSARSVTAGFAYPLSVSVGGSGSGLVSSSPVGLSCSSSCVASFGVGQTVTLTASPSAGSTLASWTGCDSSSGVTCTVSMSSVRSVSAIFSH